MVKTHILFEMLLPVILIQNILDQLYQKKRFYSRFNYCGFFKCRSSIYHEGKRIYFYIVPLFVKM